MEQPFIQLPKRIEDLIHKQRAGKLSELENIELTNWIKADINNQNAFIQFNSSLTSDIVLIREKRVCSNKKILLIIIPILIVSISLLIAKRLFVRSSLTVRSPVQDSVAMHSGILTFSDDSSLILDSTAYGTVKKIGNTIIKIDSEQFTYTIDTKQPFPEEKILYNSITSQGLCAYKIMLPDGTKISLDAASWIRYPINSVRNTRFIELDGQAYFEIKKTSDTFIIKANNLLIKTLEGHINIKAFSSDKMMTAELISKNGSFMAYDITDNDSLKVVTGVNGAEIDNPKPITETDRRKQLGLKLIGGE